jgi:aspartyl-tRNA(Asn)/glutamyl-tRNA(Gln) amidotransferase subunit A
MSLPYQAIDWNGFDAGVEKLRGLRIGLLMDAGCGLAVEADVLAAVQRAADLFTQAGAVVQPMAPFLTREMLDGMDHFWRMRSNIDLNALPPARKAKGAALHPGLGRQRRRHERH